MYQFCNPTSDWSKRRVIDYEAQPVVSLGYDNLLFPFVIMIGGAAIAGKDLSQQIILQSIPNFGNYFYIFTLHRYHHTL